MPDCRVFCKAAFAAIFAMLFAVSAWAVDGKNEVIDTIMARRSVRQYEDRAVPKEMLELVALAGINAPSAKNQQPWEVRLVTNPDFIKAATDIYVAKNPGADKAAGFRNVFRNAPAVIFVAGPSDGSGQVDGGMLGENMLLAAESLGLGTCVLGGIVDFMKRTPEMEPLIERLLLPESHTPLYAIAIGYPAEEPDAKPRNSAKIRFID